MFRCQGPISDGWLPRPATPTLRKEEVHVWRAALDQPESTTQKLLNILDPHERTRAQRFHFQKDQRRFIIAHGVLRSLLSLYLNVAPQQLVFRSNSYGKPALDCASIPSALRFNISHSNELALYAIACDREVGIDIQWMHSDFEWAGIAESFFSRREITMLHAVKSDLQTEAFYNSWTRKEAYIKARGEGLSYPLHQFTVSITPEEHAALLSTEAGAQEADRWSLQELNSSSGYAATLAVEGHDWQLKCYEYRW